MVYERTVMGLSFNKPFSFPGDSGALVFDSNQRVVGMMFDGLPIDGPGDSSLHNEGPSPKLQQQRILYKYGRASGYTKGRCSGIKHTRIANQIVNGRETRMFTYENTVTGCQDQPFSLPGDTGALTVTMHLRVVGMVAASMELWPIIFITHADDIFLLIL